MLGILYLVEALDLLFLDLLCILPAGFKLGLINGYRRQPDEERGADEEKIRHISVFVSVFGKL